MLVKNVIVEKVKVSLYPVDGRDEHISGYAVDFYRSL